MSWSFGWQSMEFLPTRTDLVRRWLVTPYAWLQCGARWSLMVFWRGYEAHPSLVSGAAVGLMMPLLGLLYLHLGGGHGLFMHGHSGPPSSGFSGVVISAERLLCVPFALTMFLGWISNAFTWGSYHAVALLLFSMGSGSLVFWMVGAFGAWTRNHGTIGTIVACSTAVILVGSYLWTWSGGTLAVRESIAQDCIKEQSWGHQSYPDTVPATPIDPDIFYCFPVAPGVLASEHCFLYGPLMGGGSQDLWLWDGTRAERVYRYCMWVH